MASGVNREGRAPAAARSAVAASILLALLLWSSTAQSQDNLTADPKEDLLRLIAEYSPASPVTADFDARVKAAAAKLEATLPRPNVAANPALVEGIWLCTYDTRDLLHAAGMKIMSGGQYPDAKIPARATIQELDPARGFYRNTVALLAGPKQIAVNYEATASLSLDPAEPNVFRVKFEQLAFVPADARYSQAEVREALGLAAGASLYIRVPPGPASPSEVTYVDADLRINRGKTYVSVLQRLR